MVDFPAPFGPTKPVTSPERTANDIPSSACVPPYRFRRPATTIPWALIAASSWFGMDSCRRFYVASGFSTVAFAATRLRPGI
ncbi:hypothetical protein GCM10009745_14690 [Kribbella yunnanensis]|uniref:Uncharacterized protein n=1 Tax=Kribbella yunnanensis TaxID=190194 RepID=A0ABN2GKP7_9ACTN